MGSLRNLYWQNSQLHVADIVQSNLSLFSELSPQICSTCFRSEKALLVIPFRTSDNQITVSFVTNWEFVTTDHYSSYVAFNHDVVQIPESDRRNTSVY